jgi:hypothetical protein
MAKKKTPARKATVGKKPAGKAVVRKAPPKKKSRSKNKQASASPSRKAPPKPPTLGRPKVTGDELLYLLFKEDYHARQVFEFLQVRTVKELEQFSAGEIIRRLSQPVRTTVERIRNTLAGLNRCLADDLEYALERLAAREK